MVVTPTPTDNQVARYLLGFLISLVLLVILRLTEKKTTKDKDKNA